MLEIEVSANEVSQRIHIIRGCQVMLDHDLAEIYNVEPRTLKQTVKRNIKRFPSDFMFELTKEDFANLRSQIVISSLETRSAMPNLRSQSVISSLEGAFAQHGGNRYMPFAFTEAGIGMLSSVLHSQKAFQVNIAIIRAFTQLRKLSRVHMESLTNRLDILEYKLDNMSLLLQDQKSFAYSDLVQRNPVQTIQKMVARYWGLTVDELRSPMRQRRISLPRQIAIYLVRNHMNLSFSEIGQYFGKRDHSTIMSAYRKLEMMLQHNSMIQETVGMIQKEIYHLKQKV